MNIKVLGSGCSSCEKLLERTRNAVKNAQIDAEIEYITDMEKIMRYGVMAMPALVVDEKVVSSGKVLQEKEVLKLIG